MSTVSRSGAGVKPWRADSAVSDSIVTRVYSRAGHTRTATMDGPPAAPARLGADSTSTSLPMCRSALRRSEPMTRSALKATTPGRMGCAR